MGISDRQENSSREKVSLFHSECDRLVPTIFRREIIQYAYRLIFECIQLLFSQTYISVTFLMMYATIWALNIRLDTQFFAVASCLLAYMQTPIVEFFSIGVKAFVNYMAAQKRIKVSTHDFICNWWAIRNDPLNILTISYFSTKLQIYYCRKITQFFAEKLFFSNVWLSILG